MGRILIIIAIAAFMFYVITRVRAFRLQDSLEKRILESRARLALGATMTALGVNLAFFLFTPPSNSLSEPSFSSSASLTLFTGFALINTMQHNWIRQHHSD